MIRGCGSANKHRDLSSNPQNSCKAGCNNANLQSIKQISNPRASKTRREQETRESPEAPRSTGLAYVTENNKKRNSVSNKVEEPTPKGGPTSTHVLCHTHTCTHQHTYRHT